MIQARIRQFSSDDIGWLVDAHQALYARDEGFDDSFGPLVRGILQDFATGHDPEMEHGWIAETPDGKPLGSIFCVRVDDATAKLRLFLLLPEGRGMGLGRMLLDSCIAFSRNCGYRQMVLWTHESHRAACALYAKTGWRLTKSVPVHNFGVDLVEQTWELDLTSDADG